MLLQTIQEGGLIAWSNLKNAPCTFATGTFKDEPKLRIYNFDFGQRKNQPILIGQSECAAPISSIAWDNFGLDQGVYPMGLIAAGTSEGSVYLFDASSVIDQQYGCVSLIEQLYEGPVATLEFNPYKPNLIALGGQDVLVVNIEKDVVSPQVFAPGDNLHEGFSITSVAWNRKVQHILASASQNGLTVVWDLKINKSIFSFQDSSAFDNRKVCLSWNPEIPTQMAVTYDDERVPELQIWDLRNPQGPVAVFSQAHQQGINNLSWCQSDQSLILTSGRDGKTICWNYKTQQIVSQDNLDFDIIDLKWSNKSPSIYAVTGADGHTEVKSLDMKKGYAPKWLKPPVGARFSADGKLIVFKENNGTVLKQYITQKEDDDDLCKFLQLESVTERIEKELAKYNQLYYTRESLDQQARKNFDHEHEQLKLLRAMAKEDICEYLTTFGFNKRDITLNTENYTGKRHKKEEEQQDSQASRQKQNQSQKPVPKVHVDFTTVTTQDAEDFFSSLTNLSQQKENQMLQKDNQQQKQQKKVPSSQGIDKSQEVYHFEQVSKNTNWDTGVEKLIKDNLIIGNYEGAIDCALKCGRSAEALLLAYSQGKDTFEFTMNTFLTAQTDYFLKNVLKNIVLKKPEDIAKNYELTNWKECAAIVLSNKKDMKEFEKIIQLIGDRFIQEKKDEQNAILCYIAGKNTDKCINIYRNQLKTLNNKSQAYREKLTFYIKCALILEQLTTQVPGYDFNEGLDFMIIELSYRLLAQQKYQAAYLTLINASEDNQVQKELLDLLYNTPSAELIRQSYDQPEFPYRMEVVNIPKNQLPSQQKPDIRKGTNQIFDSKDPIAPRTEHIKQPIQNVSKVPQPPQNKTPFPTQQSQPFPQQSPFPTSNIQNAPPPMANKLTQQSSQSQISNKSESIVSPPPPVHKAQQPFPPAPIQQIQQQQQQQQQPEPHLQQQNKQLGRPSGPGPVPVPPVHRPVPPANQTSQIQQQKQSHVVQPPAPKTVVPPPPKRN